MLRGRIEVDGDDHRESCHPGPAQLANGKLGCGLSSGYGFASGAWPFGGVEAVWTVIAIRRWLTTLTRAEAAELTAAE